MKKDSMIDWSIIVDWPTCPILDLNLLNQSSGASKWEAKAYKTVLCSQAFVSGQEGEEEMGGGRLATLVIYPLVAPLPVCLSDYASSSPSET